MNTILKCLLRFPGLPKAFVLEVFVQQPYVRSDIYYHFRGGSLEGG